MKEKGIKPFKIIKQEKKDTLILWIPALQSGIVRIVIRMFHEMHCNVGVLSRNDRLIIQDPNIFHNYINQLYNTIKEKQDSFNNIYTFSSSIGSTISLLLAKEINKDIEDFPNFRGGIYTSPIIDIEKTRDNNSIQKTIQEKTQIDIQNGDLNEYFNILKEVKDALLEINTPSLFLLGDKDTFQDISTFSKYIKKMGNPILLPQEGRDHWNCYITDEKNELEKFLNEHSQ